jgi:hypothetical protein
MVVLTEEQIEEMRETRIEERESQRRLRDNDMPVENKIRLLKARLRSTGLYRQIYKFYEKLKFGLKSSP